MNETNILACVKITTKLSQRIGFIRLSRLNLQDLNAKFTPSNITVVDDICK